MKRQLITALGVLLLSTTLWAQDVTYLLLGSYQGISYEVQMDPTGPTAKGRNKVLSGPNKDFSIVRDFSYDCPSRTIKEVHRAIYSPDGKLLQEEDVTSDWIETEKGSFARIALDKYWCKDSL